MEYLTYKEPLNVYLNLQNFSAFGFGRRICSRQNIAEKSLNILVARIAWACEIHKEEGNAYGDYEYAKEFNMQPVKFLFVLKSRYGRGSWVWRCIGDLAGAFEGWIAHNKEFVISNQCNVGGFEHDQSPVRAIVKSKSFAKEFAFLLS